ncbi:hypothetical protein ACHQM5_003179 [Ranunculus cassubicifolius]
MVFDSGIGETSVKVGLFFLVQALVYFILKNSSSIFNKDKMRSLSFKTARSVSIRRIMAALSDLPPGGEPSPSSSSQPIIDERLKGN